jgi:hypothetical protein
VDPVKIDPTDISTDLSTDMSSKPGVVSDKLTGGEVGSGENGGGGGGGVGGGGGGGGEGGGGGREGEGSSDGSGKEVNIYSKGTISAEEFERLNEKGATQVAVTREGEGSDGDSERAGLKDEKGGVMNSTHGFKRCSAEDVLWRIVNNHVEGAPTETTATVEALMQVSRLQV